MGNGNGDEFWENVWAALGQAFRIVGLILKWSVTILASLIALSVLWVAVYRFVGPPTTFYIVQTELSGTAVDRRWIPIEAVAPAVWETVIAAEDQSFCLHDGFDRKAIEEARQRNAHGGRLRGASTISQQTAKNAFLWPARTYVRKGFEAYFTVLEEFLWPKRRIMEVYLNVAEFGRGVFGVEAASQRFFGKPARNLSRYEAALLVTVLPNPKVRHPENPRPYVVERANVLMGRAYGVRNDGLTRCMVAAEK